MKIKLLVVIVIRYTMDSYGPFIYYNQNTGKNENHRKAKVASERLDGKKT